MVLGRDPIYSGLIWTSTVIHGRPIVFRSWIPFWILFVGVIMCAVILIIALQVGFGMGFGEGLTDIKI